MLVIAIVAFLLWNNRGVITAHKSIEGFDEAVQPVANASTPEGTQVVALGTDFFKTKVNVRSVSGMHVEASICSTDPLAAQMERQPMKKGYLDFATITPDRPSLYQAVNDPIAMGSLGESHSWFYKLIPYVYRTNWTPSELYDSMIFVYQVNPTLILE